MTEMAILNDVTKCIGCRACQSACKQWNELPAEKTTFANTCGYQNPADLSHNTWTLVKFIEWDENQEVRWNFLRLACKHCSDAACQEICPVDAIDQTDEGFVIINQEECVTCGMCKEACPYDIPRMGATATKCRFCIDRVYNDLEPSCVKTCPTSALLYGPRDEMLERAHEISRKNPDWHVYGEEELDGLHTLFVLPGKLETFELVKNPKHGKIIDFTKALKYIIPGSLLISGLKLISGVDDKSTEDVKELKS